MSNRSPSRGWDSQPDFPPHVSDPFAGLAHASHELWTVSLHVALGLVAGLLCARAMRRRHLHWSWAAATLGLVAVARPVLGWLTATLSAAALSATLRGRRWHREDLDAGADLAEVAIRRHSPIDALWAALRSSVTRTGLVRVRKRTGDGRLVLGCDEAGASVEIPFGGAGGASHTLVVGATGSGKTVTQTAIATQAIARGMGAIVIDPKGDVGLRTEIRRAAMAAGRRFIEWSPGGPSVYNPYARGSETEIADKVLASERFTEPHYQRQAQRYLGHVVRTLRAAGRDVSLHSLVEHMAPDRLEHLARGLPEGQAHPTHAYLDALTSRQQADLSGVRDRLAILAESDVGAWLDGPARAGSGFDLLGAARERAVVYFDLRADSRPLLAQMLGGAIVQDLRTTIAVLQSEPVATIAMIDEFSALAAEQVVSLFARARSAGVSLVLGTQELSDLRVAGREGLLERVMGNLSVLIAHRQVVPDSAKLIGGLAGTRGTWRTSRQPAGGVTRTRVRENVLACEEVTTLRTGWAAVIALSEGATAQITHIQPVAG